MARRSLKKDKVPKSGHFVMRRKRKVGHCRWYIPAHRPTAEARNERAIPQHSPPGTGGPVHRGFPCCHCGRTATLRLQKMACIKKKKTAVLIYQSKPLLKLKDRAYASYLPGMNTAFIRDDATISDVLEEMYHAEQDRTNMFGGDLTHEVRLRREIDAQKHLLSLNRTV